jgi:hypothetical protein
MEIKQYDNRLMPIPFYGCFLGCIQAVMNKATKWPKDGNKEAEAEAILKTYSWGVAKEDMSVNAWIYDPVEVLKQAARSIGYEVEFKTWTGVGDYSKETDYFDYVIEKWKVVGADTHHFKTRFYNPDARVSLEKLVSYRCVTITKVTKI